MKTTIGVFAVLLLVTTFAIGQQYQEPFPQSANPALANGTVRGSSASVNADLPSSMAVNQSSMAADRPDNPALGLPFPQSANPALANGTVRGSPASVNADLPSLMAINQSSMAADRPDNPALGSPFPSAANPSSNW